MSNAKRLGLIIATAGLLAVVLGFWLGRPAYRRYKEKRMLAEVRENLKKGDYRAALLGLKQTLMINPANVEAVLRRGELATEFQTPDALLWRQRLVELAPTVNHKILLVDTGLRMEKPPYPISTQTLLELRQAGAETNAAYQVVAWQLAAAQKRFADAEKHLLALTHFDPTNRLHQLNLASVRLGAKDKTVADNARRELSALASDRALGAFALRVLITDALGDRRFDEADRLSVQLLALPDSHFGDRLARLDALHQAHSKQMTPWLAEVKRTAATNVMFVVNTASWLLGNGMASDALAWLDSLAPAMQTMPPLPALKADCYGVLRDWPGQEQYLTKQNWDEREYVRLGMLARALREQNRREMAGAQWRRAVAAAGNRAASQSELAQMASSWGRAGDADELWWAVVKRAPWDNRAWMGLVNNRRLAGDTAGLYRVYKTRLESAPDSLVVKNDVAVIGLLLNTNMDQSMRLAQTVYEAQPSNAAFASTYALGLHLRGQSAVGLKVMEALPEAALRRPDIAAYQAILLSAVGKKEQAKPYFAAAEIAKHDLLPEERRLLAQAGGPK